MSIEFPQFTGKARDIVEGLRRGEEVSAIALRLDTTPAYIYNVRAEARRLGLTLGPPRTSTQQGDNQQLEQPQPPREHSTPHALRLIVREPDAIIYADDLLNATDIGIMRLIKSDPLVQQLEQQWRIQQQPPAPPPKRDVWEDWEELSRMPEKVMEAWVKMYPSCVMFSAGMWYLRGLSGNRV